MQASSFVRGALSLTIIVGALLGGATAVYAAAPAGTPDVQVRLGDSNDGSPNLPGQCGTEVSGWAGTGETASIQGDADCAQIRIGGFQQTYDRDFRLCMSLGGDTACTPWASEGGGLSRVINGGNNFSSVAPFVETAAVPISGMRFTGVQAGVQLYYQSGNGGCGGSSGMMFSNGGGESGWAFGAQRDDDPGCGRVGLQAQELLPPNARYSGDTVPRMATISTTYRDAFITMQNTGLTWTSDQIVVPESGACASFHPATPGQTCTDSYVVQSNGFVLKRTDTTPVTADAELPYRRTVGVTYRSVRYQECEDVGGGTTVYGPVRAFFQRIVRFILPATYARERGDIVCTTINETIRTESPQRDVHYTASADFPLTLTTPAAPGEYVLTYRMYQRSTNQFFGDTATMPITIPDPGPLPDTTPRYDFACQTVEQTVTRGEVASYHIAVASHNSFAGSVAVSVSGLPGGATSPGGSVTLTANATSSTIIPVQTSPTTPVSTSTITFVGTATIGTSTVTRSCGSLLVVRGLTLPFTPTLTVTPEQASTTVGTPATFNAFYDPDGAAGVQQPTLVTASANTTWSVAEPGVAQVTGAGTLMGIAPGTAYVQATYGGITDDAILQVTGSPGGTTTSTLGVALEVATTSSGWANTLAGRAPLNGVDLRATALGTATGTITYTFYCNRADAGTTITTPYDYRIQGTLNPVQPVADACSYETAGTYTTKVIISRDGHVAEDRVIITVGAPRDPDATLLIQPSIRSIERNEVTTYDAFYDADGPGTGVAARVTSDAVWSSDDEAIALPIAPPGSFRGTTNGTTTIHAAYEGSVADASIVVGSLTPTPTSTTALTAGLEVASSTLVWASSITDAAPLTTSMRAMATGTATGTLNYTFYCDRADAGTNITPGWALKRDTQTDTTLVTTNVCSYPTPGTYTGKVIIERGGHAAEHRVSITVTDGTDGEDDPNATLVVEPPSREIRPGSIASYTAVYDPDGPGPRGVRTVTDQAVWVSGNTSIATLRTPGVFRGEALGETFVRATYKGKTAFGSLAVKNNPDDGGDDPNATLTIDPPALAIRPGDTASYTAAYDPDGPGPRRPTTVTFAASWISGDTRIATAQTPGSFRGEALGETFVRAQYKAKSAFAALAVKTNPGGGDDDDPRLVAALEVSSSTPDRWTTGLRGPAPITASFRAIALGTATGTINYTFYCDRSDTGTNVTLTNPRPALKVDGTMLTTYTASRLCFYALPGTYTGKVIIERGGRAVERRVPIVVTTPIPPDPTDLSCTFGANPRSIFVPPYRSSALSWSCNRPTTCTVGITSGAANRIGVTIGTGGQSGSASDQPRVTTQYRLTCDGVGIADERVRVFDVNTRQEILPN